LTPYQFKTLGGSEGNGNHRIDRRLYDIIYGKREHAVSKPGHAGSFGNTMTSASGQLDGTCSGNSALGWNLTFGLVDCTNGGSGSPAEIPMGRTRALPGSRRPISQHIEGRGKVTRILLMTAGKM